MLSSSPVVTKIKRGRKSNIQKLDNANIILPLHHFKYSDDFAEQLANFAKTNLDNKTKQFKEKWSEWTKEHADEIQIEIQRMREAGYIGSVEDKMYFSARYYYRKKAIKEENTTVSKDATPTPTRKTYESVNSEILSQMNAHIISQIYSCDNSDVAEGEKKIVNITPSKLYATYCEKYSVSCKDDKMKKTYKNLYWRITSNSTTFTRASPFGTPSLRIYNLIQLRSLVPLPSGLRHCVSIT
jgi:hypothetical protein